MNLVSVMRENAKIDLLYRPNFYIDNVFLIAITIKSEEVIDW